MTTERTTDNRILHQLTESDCQEHKESLYLSIVRPTRMCSKHPPTWARVS